MKPFKVVVAGLAVVTLLSAGSAAAADDASFKNQAVPASLSAGTSTSVSITFANTGTTSWTVSGGYVLACPDPADGGNWEVDTIGLPSTVDAGSTVTFTFRITAPRTPGTYNFRWQMEHGTTFFGAASTNVPIKVVVRPTVSDARTWDARQAEAQAEDFSRLRNSSISSSTLRFSSGAAPALSYQ